jgi:carbon storage regulator
MLVLTRKEGEEVVIADPLHPTKPLGFVRVLSVKGDRVRIGVELPRSMGVHRREVFDIIASDAVEKTAARASA